MPRTKAVPRLRDRIVDLRRIPARDLQDHQQNWRTHPAAQKDALQGVLADLGIASALLVYESVRQGGLCVIDGHLRKSLDPAQEWPCLLLDLDDDEATYLLATHDPLGAMAEASREALAHVLESVQSGQASVQQLLAQLAEQHGVVPSTLGPEAVEDVEPEIDRAEELRQQYGVESGQCWQAGTHRVICGDCTDKGVVERVMDGATFRLLVTSPPYGDLRDYQSPIADWQKLAIGFMHAAVAHCATPGDLLINLGLLHKDGMVSRYWEPWLTACEAWGWPVYGWYVWDKGHGFPGEWNGRLAPCHEWLFHFSSGHHSAQKWIATNGSAAKRGQKGHTFRQRDGSLREATSQDKIGQLYKIPDSVLRLEPEQARGLHTQLHPAVYPVALPAFIVSTWSKAGDIVYDPFLGSGTTLIACEQLGRVCRGVELAPEYVAVTLHRWATLTGQTPTLVEG